MQQNIFKVKCILQNGVYHSRGGRFHPYTLQTYKIYICPITSQDIFLVKVYYEMNLSDGRSHRPVDL